MTSAERKLLLPFLNDCVRLATSPMIYAKARRLLERFDRKPSIKKRAIKKERKQKKIRERRAHWKETATIRAAVFDRALGECELCGTLMWGGEMHHLESGFGRRGRMQAVSNCMAVHPDCHVRYHRNPEAFRAAVIAWTEKHGYSLSGRFSRPARPGNARTLKGEAL